MAHATFNNKSSSSATEKNLVRTELARSGKHAPNRAVKLPTNGSSPEQAAEILSLSMPANAQYPECLFAVLSTFSEKTLTSLVSEPDTVMDCIITCIQKENRRKWVKSENQPKRGLDAEALEAIAARRRWLFAEMSLLVLDAQRP
jgi:hypothetical protein